MNNFPADFIWGTSTSAFQIEGALSAAGRLPSIWDCFSSANGETGAIACDHYHRWETDLDLLMELGAQNYRFSVSWPRIAAGDDFYSRLVDGLLDRGITPWVTLYHWDLPQALQDKGGWLNREIVSWSTDYFEVVAQRLGDRVENWILLNEPTVHAYFGHGTGEHAPGLTGEENVCAALHHMNMAVGQGYRRLKALNVDWNIGSSYYITQCVGEGVETADALWNAVCFDPLFKGQYPSPLQEHFELYIQPDDMGLIKTDLDFIGLQHYDPLPVKKDPNGLFGIDFGEKDAGLELTDAGWSIEPEAFTQCLIDFRAEYGDMPLVVTESGAVFFDELENGAVDDQRRAEFLKKYTGAAGEAIKAGVNLKGYFVWSFLDNFEWAFGHKYRFGLVYTDYENDLKRIPKSSFYWYRDFIRTQMKVAA